LFPLLLFIFCFPYLLTKHQSGSFITNEENRYDFYDSNDEDDEEKRNSFISSIPMFPEDFKQDHQQPWPLSWWGIVEPNPELIRIHLPKEEQEVEDSTASRAASTKVFSKASTSTGATPTKHVQQQQPQHARSYPDSYYNTYYPPSRPYNNSMGPPPGRLPPSYYPPRPPYYHGGGPPPPFSAATGPPSYGRGRAGGGESNMYYSGAPYDTSAYPRSYHPSAASTNRPKEGTSSSSTSTSNKPHRSNK
jgi:hypothetical protein